MKTIVAGTDFSPCSLNACRYAAMLAQKLNCKLSVFNLFLAPILHSNSGLYGISYSSVKKSSDESIQDLVKQLAKEFPNIKIHAFTSDGVFSEALKAYLDQHQVETVVMGLETKTRIAKFIWGSHGVNIAGKINAPVIVVPERYKAHRLDRILLAVDNSEKLKAASLHELEKFAKSSHAELIPIHIRTPEEVIRPLSDNKLKLKTGIKEIQVFKSTSIESGIKKHSHDTDMVAIISKKHSVFYNLFNESVTKRVAFAARVPVMAIHE